MLDERAQRAIWSKRMSEEPNGPVVYMSITLTNLSEIDALNNVGTLQMDLTERKTSFQHHHQQQQQQQQQQQ